MQKYIFRLDKDDPFGEVNTPLTAHDGTMCKAEITEAHGVMSLVDVEFEDGHKDRAFVYELEEVADGN